MRVKRTLSCDSFMDHQDVWRICIDCTVLFMLVKIVYGLSLLLHGHVLLYIPLCIYLFVTRSKSFCLNVTQKKTGLSQFDSRIS